MTRDDRREHGDGDGSRRKQHCPRHLSCVAIRPVMRRQRDGRPHDVEDVDLQQAQQRWSRRSGCRTAGGKGTRGRTPATRASATARHDAAKSPVLRNFDSADSTTAMPARNRNSGAPKPPSIMAYAEQRPRAIGDPGPRIEHVRLDHDQHSHPAHPVEVRVANRPGVIVVSGGGFRGCRASADARRCSS